MGVARKAPWWKSRIQELEQEVKRLEEELDNEREATRDLNRELREQATQWADRLADAYKSKADIAADNLAALDASLETEDDDTPPGRVRAGLEAYTAFINGGNINEDHAPIHWAKDYMTQAAEEESVEDVEA